MKICNNKEFDKKFGNRIHQSFECSDAERLFVEIKQFIETQIPKAKIKVLKNIFKEYVKKVGICKPNDGCIECDTVRDIFDKHITKLKKELK